MSGTAEVSWLPRLGATHGPKYRAIADAIANAVVAGVLRPGDRLPPQRELAKALAVDLTTITRAFSEAQRRGLLDAQVGRGSFVRGHQPPAAAALPSFIDMTMNMPPQPAAAGLQARITTDVAAIMAAPDALTQLHYQNSAGIAHHRQAAATWLARRLGPLSAERVLVTSGAQYALAAVLEHVLAPGDTLCAPALTYPGLRAAAERAGYRIDAVAMDREGIDPDAFETACKRGKPKLLYVVPTLDNPTTATIGLERRRVLAAIAERHGVVIIEDDAYGALAVNAPPPIAAIAPAVTWHIATLSKCATPALRIAYVVAPSHAEGLRLAGEMRATSLMAPPLMSALAARWIENGTLDRISDAIREENRARQAVARQALGEAAIARPEGHHIWLTLPPHWQRGAFVAQALHSGLALAPSDAFATTNQPPEAVRVSIGVVADRQRLEQALQRLGNLLNHRHAAATII